MLTSAVDSTKRSILRGDFAQIREAITAFALACEREVPCARRGVRRFDGAGPEGGNPGTWYFGDGVARRVHVDREARAGGAHGFGTGGITGAGVLIAAGAVWQLLGLLVLTPATVAAQPTVVPLRVHIVSGITLEKRGVTMDSWVSTDDLRRVVMPAVNEIWKQAGVEWHVAAIDTLPALAPPDRAARLERIRDAQRDARGKADPERIGAWAGLIDFAAADGAAVDVYLVPYLGETSQGNASRRHKRVLVALWTDKANRGRDIPTRVKLSEPEPFRVGSLSRTIAHELGHILGLRHPKKRQQTAFGRLMGGKRPGYRLTRKEREIARAAAQDLF